VLADDQHVVREAVRCLLDLQPDFRVVGETADGLEVLPLVERQKPRVLVVDVALPGLCGFEVTRQIRDRAPGTAVLMLSRYVNEWYAGEALRSGATGYVVKHAHAAELINGIRAVADGHRYVGRPLTEGGVKKWMRRLGDGVEDPYDRLTPRERQVLQLVAEGSSSPQIARRLAISARTAESHRANVMTKLRLRNQTALIRYAFQHGIIPPAEPVPSPLRAGRAAPHTREPKAGGRRRDPGER
jgi:DNA-binding NarL/FixJ family response regulator